MTKKVNLVYFIWCPCRGNFFRCRKRFIFLSNAFICSVCSPHLVRM